HPREGDDEQTTRRGGGGHVQAGHDREQGSASRGRGMMLRTGCILRAVAHACHRRPVMTVLLAVALTVLAIPVTLTMLTFEPSDLHPLPPGQPYVERFREYPRQFGELDEIIIVVRAQSPAESKAYAARLVAVLEAGPIRFNRLVYRYSPESLDGRM